MRHFATVVIGGGAAGIMAAGVAASRGGNVLLCERMEKPQRKVRITGKGRCNLTNLCSEEEFLAKVRCGADFFASALHRFDSEATMRFFEHIGVPLTVERGRRVFPSSGKAWDIADAHVGWCRTQGVTIETHARVTEITARTGQVTGIILETAPGQSETITCENVILATGGASYPATGSTGDGYRLAHRLGHTIVPIRPSLTPLITGRPTPRPMAGLTLRNISVLLLINGRSVAEEFGEMEFLPKGVSGPVVLRLSRRAVDALIDGERVEFSLDLKPALSPEQLTGRLVRETAALPPKAAARSLAAKLVPSVLIGEWLKRAGIHPEEYAAALTPIQQKALIGALKKWTIGIADYAPFTEAIVTAGGVSVDEIDPSTMQSKLVKGLYFAGEVLDIDADTGGYNLQIAYSTGHLAGELKP
ncbi:NAD(P)/FAD-dependent oxidoreductase [Alistipes indistinctus]|uniref:NAD(P)/FAD-dependent oxidoreductase n=1 Tax=Alistipes indistinctus TaxID=626932 RepID=UPI0026DBD2A6|nr:NAD(P)/FAD-dependent oxidoreductase [Alistipes indistinctus]